MTYRELCENAYQILSQKPLCISQSGELKVFKNTSKICSTLKKASLFYPLSLCKENLNLFAANPRRLKKKSNTFALSKIENFKLYMDLSGTFRLRKYYTYSKTVHALAEDLFLQFEKTATPEQRKAPEFQERYLDFLKKIDTFEICNASETDPLVCDNAGHVVDRLRPTTFYETYDVVAYKFTNLKDKLAVNKRIDDIANGRKSEEQVQINFDKVIENT